MSPLENCCKKLQSSIFLGVTPNKLESGNNFTRFLARFRIRQKYIETSNLNIECYKTPPHKILQTILRHTVQAYCEIVQKI